MTTTPQPLREDLVPGEVDIDRLSIDELAHHLRLHNYAYFTLARPKVSDAYFDKLEAKLRALDPDNVALREIGGPTVGAKIEHAVPMLSLEKCNTTEEFFAWLKGVCVTLTGRTHQAVTADDVLAWAATPQAALVATPKIDGLACSIQYDARGKLRLAATRGDGFVGENVTRNAKRIPSIPNQLQDGAGWPHGPIEVRGEVYLPLSVFRTVQDQYANPRNLAAGTLKSKEKPAVPAEQLRFFAYDVLGPALTSESEKFEFARRVGLTPAPHQACRATEAADVFAQYLEASADLDYEADGVVIKIDDLAAQERLGITSHHPRGAIAWKFTATSGLTTLDSIEWSVSRTGMITPVAIVAPVSLSGATVTRATLHNLSNVRRLGLQLGDTVELVRRGGVIPHLEATRGGGHAPVVPPADCPSCGGPTREVASTRKVGGQDVTTTVLQCSRPETCTIARHRQLLHFCATLEIEGFGEKVIDTLMEAGLLNDPSDLYTLQAGDLTGLPRFGTVMIGNLMAQVDKARTVPEATFLRALGIETLGKHAADLLAARWSLEELRAASEGDIANLHSLGEITAQRIAEGLREAAPLVDRLLEQVRVTRPKGEVHGQGPMSGQVVVFTGKLERMGRRDAQQRVVRMGGQAGDAVTQDTTLLVVGADEMGAAEPSSKMKKAQKLREAGRPIEILPEADFWSRVEAATT